VPLYKAPDSDDAVTQFEGPTVEKVGLLKMDFLGLRTLTVIANTVKLIEQSRGVTVDIEQIPYDDQATFQLLGEAKTFRTYSPLAWKYPRFRSASRSFLSKIRCSTLSVRWSS
jgi:DNA polymerase-3 subunit alpha